MSMKATAAPHWAMAEMAVPSDLLELVEIAPTPNKRRRTNSSVSCHELGTSSTIKCPTLLTRLVRVQISASHCVYVSDFGVWSSQGEFWRILSRRND